MNMKAKTLVTAAIVALSPFAVSAATVVPGGTATVGLGGTDGGFATSITFDEAARRGTSNDRDNALNALGATDGEFFEIGLRSTVDLTFGTLFTGSGSIVEVTFGRSPSSALETAEVRAGLNGTFTLIGTISNALETSTVTFGAGVFDTLRLTDTTSTNATTGGFDIDSVNVSAVPLPAAGLLLIGALGGLMGMRRRKS